MSLFVLEFQGGMDTIGNYRNGYLIVDSKLGYLAAVRNEVKSSRCLIEEFGEELGSKLRLKEIGRLDVSHKQYNQLMESFGKEGRKRANKETIQNCLDVS